MKLGKAFKRIGKSISHAAKAVGKFANPKNMMGGMGGMGGMFGGKGGGGGDSTTSQAVDQMLNTPQQTQAGYGQIKYVGQARQPGTFY